MYGELEESSSSAGVAVTHHQRGCVLRRTQTACFVCMRIYDVDVSKASQDRRARCVLS